MTAPDNENTPYRITKVWIEDEHGETFLVTPDGGFSSVNPATGQWTGRIAAEWNPPKAVVWAIEDLFTTQQEVSA